MNIFVLTGNLGQDAETSTTPGGSVLTKAKLAVQEFYQGEKHTMWVELTLWGDLGKNFANVCGKGDKVAVSGRISKRTWQTREGENRSAYDFVVNTWELSSRSEANKERRTNEQYDDTDDSGTEEETPRYAF